MADTPDNKDTPTDQQGDAPEQGEATGDAKGDAVEPSAESMAEQSLESVEKAADDIEAETGSASAPASDEAQAVQLPDFESNGESGAHNANLGMLNDIDLNVKVELGRTRMYIEDVLRLNANSIVELDKAAGDPVDIYVNDRHVARGEVLVLSENFCVRVSEIIEQPDEDADDEKKDD